MSLLDPNLLKQAGIRVSGYRVPIPLYVSTRLVEPASDIVAPTNFSLQELSALMLQIDSHSQFTRFITLPLLVAGPSRRPGPASQTIFAVDDVRLRGREATLLVPANFRTEMSAAYSRTYFLQQHAIVASVQEGRPLSDYFDRTSFDQAKRLYPGNMSPLDDLEACVQYPSRNWRQYFANPD